MCCDIPKRFLRKHSRRTCLGQENNGWIAEDTEKRIVREVRTKQLEEPHFSFFPPSLSKIGENLRYYLYVIWCWPEVNCSSTLQLQCSHAFILVLVVFFLSRCFFIAQIELLAAAICTRVTNLQIMLCFDLLQSVACLQRGWKNRNITDTSTTPLRHTAFVCADFEERKLGLFVWPFCVIQAHHLQIVIHLLTPGCAAAHR